MPAYEGHQLITNENIRDRDYTMKRQKHLSLYKKQHFNRNNVTSLEQQSKSRNDFSDLLLVNQNPKNKTSLQGSFGEPNKPSNKLKPLEMKRTYNSLSINNIEFKETKNYKDKSKVVNGLILPIYKINENRILRNGKDRTNPDLFLIRNQRQNMELWEEDLIRVSAHQAVDDILNQDEMNLKKRYTFVEIKENEHFNKILDTLKKKIEYKDEKNACFDEEFILNLVFHELNTPEGKQIFGLNNMSLPPIRRKPLIQSYPSKQNSKNYSGIYNEAIRETDYDSYQETEKYILQTDLNINGNVSIAFNDPSQRIHGSDGMIQYLSFDGTQAQSNRKNKNHNSNDSINIRKTLYIQDRKFKKENSLIKSRISQQIEINRTISSKSEDESDNEIEIVNVRKVKNKPLTLSKKLAETTNDLSNKVPLKPKMQILKDQKSNIKDNLALDHSIKPENLETDSNNKVNDKYENMDKGLAENKLKEEIFISKKEQKLDKFEDEGSHVDEAKELHESSEIRNFHHYLTMFNLGYADLTNFRTGVRQNTMPVTMPTLEDDQDSKFRFITQYNIAFRKCKLNLDSPEPGIKKIETSNNKEIARDRMASIYSEAEQQFTESDHHNYVNEELSDKTELQDQGEEFEEEEEEDQIGSNEFEEIPHKNRILNDEPLKIVQLNANKVETLSNNSIRNLNKNLEDWNKYKKEETGLQIIHEDEKTDQGVKRDKTKRFSVKATNPLNSIKKNTNINRTYKSSSTLVDKGSRSNHEIPNSIRHNTDNKTKITGKVVKQKIEAKEAHDVQNISKASVEPTMKKVTSNDNSVNHHSRTVSQTKAKDITQFDASEVETPVSEKKEEITEEISENKSYKISVDFFSKSKIGASLISDLKNTNNSVFYLIKIRAKV